MLVMLEFWFSVMSVTSGICKDWGDRDVDEWLKDYSAILTWPDKESALKLAFKKSLSNTAQLQMRKVYGFPDVEDTKFTKLEPGH